jgi:hypothetical protein
MAKTAGIEVERNRLWTELDAAVVKASMVLVDQTHAIAGRTPRLVITKAQKQQLLAWVDQHFPEFKGGIPKDQWTNPARSVQVYLRVFGGRKCADE